MNGARSDKEHMKNIEGLLRWRCQCWRVCQECLVWFLQTLEVHRLLEEGIRSGEVAPLPVTVFDRANVSDAFRFMAAGAAYPPS